MLLLLHVSTRCKGKGTKFYCSRKCQGEYQEMFLINLIKFLKSFLLFDHKMGS